MSMPTNMIILDVETEYKEKDNVQTHVFKMGWTVLAHRKPDADIYYEEWKLWKDATAMWKYIDNSVRDKTAVYLFGNNIYFDLQAAGFFKYFAKIHWTLDFIYDNGLTYILCIRNKARSIKVLSLTNFFEASVKDLGRLIGLEKIELDFTTADMDALTIYCFRDVEICLDTMANYFTFLEENDLGEFSLSRASQAMHAYRHRFMKTNLFTHESEVIYELEQKAYYGGRTECFNIGEQTGGPFVCYDINSLYPYVMRNNHFPIKPIDYRKKATIRQLESWLKLHAVISHVYLKTDVPIYACRIKHKVIFPIGEFDTYLCSEGLREAIKRGHITEVRETTIYQTADLFSEYIDFFYALRLEAKRTGNKIMDKYAKIFMNSLYGKFGQQVPYTVDKKPTKTSEYSREEILDAETGENWIVTKILGQEITEYGRHPTSSTIMSIPAHVTEYARILLWRIIESVGRENVIYCDTDSIWIRASDANKVNWPVSDIDLGALKAESKTSRFACYAPKDYATDDMIKIKGVPKKAIKIGPNEYEYWQFQRQRSHLKANVDVGYRIKRVHKKITRRYDKGQVLPNGMVIPWEFSLSQPVAPVLMEDEPPSDESDGD
jgi:hypothetical protein